MACHARCGPPLTRACHRCPSRPLGGRAPLCRSQALQGECSDERPVARASAPVARLLGKPLCGRRAGYVCCCHLHDAGDCDPDDSARACTHRHPLHSRPHLRGGFVCERAQCACGAAAGGALRGTDGDDRGGARQAAQACAPRRARQREHPVLGCAAGLCAGTGRRPTRPPRRGRTRGRPPFRWRRACRAEAAARGRPCPLHGKDEMQICRQRMRGGAF